MRAWHLSLGQLEPCAGHAAIGCEQWAANPSQVLVHAYSNDVT
jgi:hypothetical protein